jgi:transposase-like protein
MAETRRKFDEDFKQGAVRIVRETGKPIALVARELGINEGTWGIGVRRSAGGAAWTVARSLRMSGPSWSGCGGRMRS